MEQREKGESVGFDDEKWVYDSSVDHKGRVPLRATTGVWKASLFIIGKNKYFFFFSILWCELLCMYHAQKKIKFDIYILTSLACKKIQKPSSSIFWATKQSQCLRNVTVFLVFCPCLVFFPCLFVLHQVFVYYLFVSIWGVEKVENYDKNSQFFK